MIRLLHFRSIHDETGDLTPIGGGSSPFGERDIPFIIKRVFYLHDVVAGARRGGHAHRELEEVIIAVSGSFDVVTLTENGPQRWQLNRADRGLYLSPNVWRHLENFSTNATALVLASTPYDPADYIRDEAEFLAGLPPVAGGFYRTPDDVLEAVRAHG